MVMFKRLFNLLLVIVLIIPCIAYDAAYMIFIIFIYSPIMYVYKGMTLPEIIAQRELCGMNLILKLLD